MHVQGGSSGLALTPVYGSINGLAIFPLPLSHSLVCQYPFTLLGGESDFELELTFWGG